MKTAARTAILKIENCLDCPHSKQIHDPSSPDLFDFHDVSLACTLTLRPNGARAKTDLGEEIPGRLIVACERSIKRAQTKVPKWCPLIRRKS